MQVKMREMSKTPQAAAKAMTPMNKFFFWDLRLSRVWESALLLVSLPFESEPLISEALTPLEGKSCGPSVSMGQMVSSPSGRTPLIKKFWIILRVQVDFWARLK